MLDDCRGVVCAGALKNAHLGPQETQRFNISLMEDMVWRENSQSSLGNDCCAFPLIPPPSAKTLKNPEHIKTKSKRTDHTPFPIEVSQLMGQA